MENIFVLNVLCMAVIAILSLGLRLQASNKKNKSFFRLLSSLFFYLLLDLSCNILEFIKANDTIIFILNLLAFLSIDIIILMFTSFLQNTIESNSNECKTLFLNIARITVTLRMIVILILAFTNNLFTIENGVYIEFDYAIIAYIGSSIVMIELIIAMIINKKSFTKRELIVMLLYELLPIIPLIVEIFTDIYSITSTSLTVSILLVYVLVQDSNIEDAKEREKILEDISTKDQLTDLQNRRAYYMKISEIPSEEEIGIIFCDLNSLKYTNDHFGHKAGDDLIKFFADLESKHLGYENVYRISGDEFVTIIEKKSYENFKSLAEAFRKTIEKNHYIAAIGYTYGKGCCFEKLVSEAEELMYEDKKITKAKAK